jgi:hypothetical protein
MLIRILLPLFFLSCLACKNISNEEPGNKLEKFDKVKWVTRNERQYPFRDGMLKDLMANYELHGIKKDSILNLLGPPDRTDSSYLFYTVAQQFLGNFTIPLHTKTLVIKFMKDSTLEWRKIHE